MRLWGRQADISQKETNVASQHRSFLSHGGSLRARHPGRFERAVVTEAGTRCEALWGRSLPTKTVPMSAFGFVREL